MRLPVALAALLLALPARGEDALVTCKSLSPEVTLDLARAALASCRDKGFQVGGPLPRSEFYGQYFINGSGVTLCSR